jgi:quercetin dioxygenase-like cupin family protein
MSTAKYVDAASGKKITIFGGVEFYVKVSSEESGGTLTLVDNHCPPGTFLPPHIHQREDETFYILEGEYEFEVAGSVIKAGPGDTVYAPKGVPHSFKVTSAVAGRNLVACVPGGFEIAMEELSKLPMDPPDMMAVVQTCAKYGMMFLPPPPPV